MASTRQKGTRVNLNLLGPAAVSETLGLGATIGIVVATLLSIGAGACALWLFIPWSRGERRGPFSSQVVLPRTWGALICTRRGGDVAYVLPADASDRDLFMLQMHLKWRKGPFRRLLPTLAVAAGAAGAAGGWLVLGAQQQVPGVLLGSTGAALLLVRGINDVQLKPPAGTVRDMAVEHGVDSGEPLAALLTTFDAAAEDVAQGRISKPDWLMLRQDMWRLAGHDHPSRSEVAALTTRIQAITGPRS